jgi:manganese/zinc/iron transport system substrate-binding protein
MFFGPSKSRRSKFRRWRILGFAVSVCAALCWSGCGYAPAGRDPAGRVPHDGGSRPPLVLATTTIVADLVRQLAGERVRVESLMAAGVDPHSYKATPRDADRLAAADLVVASGLGLEGKLAELLTRLGRRGHVMTVTEQLPEEDLLSVGGGRFDPHVWFDCGLWKRCVPTVAEALVKLDPAGTEEIRARAAAFVATLDEVDAQVRGRLASISDGRRVLVTAHDAFQYFGRAYGIEVVGVQGTNTESEAGLGDINRLVDLLVEREIPVVFLETSVSDRNVRALLEGAAARGHEVQLGGRLYSDALGGPGSGAETLAGAILANVDTIVAGLGGSLVAGRP